SSLQWLSFLLGWLVVCHEVEPMPISSNNSPVNDKNENIPEKLKFHANQTIPEFLVFILPEGECLRIIYHVDEYGFYLETVG
ncbi:hypothetical protein KR009_000889, partial [Drosophila setifemur]